MTKVRAGIKRWVCVAMLLGLIACGRYSQPLAEGAKPLAVTPSLQQTAAQLLDGQVMAVAYSGYREGQHPDRGTGEVVPSDAEILEDLHILVAHGFTIPVPTPTIRCA